MVSYETENQELHLRRIPAYRSAGFIPLIYYLLSVAFMSLSSTYHKGLHNENESKNTLIFNMQRKLTIFAALSVKDKKVHVVYLAVTNIIMWGGGGLIFLFCIILMHAC